MSFKTQLGVGEGVLPGLVGRVVLVSGIMNIGSS
jgi:hypothetical protein